MARPTPRSDSDTLDPMPKGERFLKLTEAGTSLESLLCDVALLGMWELIRVAGRPVTLKQIADASGLEPLKAQRQIDVLIAHGLIEVLPIKGRRRATSYQSTCDGLAIECELPTDAPIVERIVTTFSKQVEDAMAPSVMGTDEHSAIAWRAGFHSLCHLQVEERKELRRRLRSLIEYIDQLGEKRPSSGAMPPLANYGVGIRIDPLPKPALPLPRIRFMDAKGAQERRDTETASRANQANLSSREREVALALVRGLTRPEVAAELGISAATVATLTKRIHAKLGVHRRAELVTRVRELLGNASA